MRNNIIKTIAVSALCLSFNANAATNSSDIKIQANINGGCLLSAENVNFGSIKENEANNGGLEYNPSNLFGFESRLNINVHCSKNLPYVLSGEPYPKNPTGGYSHELRGIVSNDYVYMAFFIMEGSNKGTAFADGGYYGGTTTNIKGVGSGSNQKHSLFAGIYNNRAGLPTTPDIYVKDYTLTLTY